MASAPWIDGYSNLASKGKFSTNYLVKQYYVWKFSLEDHKVSKLFMCKLLYLQVYDDGYIFSMYSTCFVLKSSLNNVFSAMISLCFLFNVLYFRHLIVSSCIKHPHLPILLFEDFFYSWHRSSRVFLHS